ncbi:hypothetical protein F3Y22_tig00018040pilonHSYRG00013 [Hibiscus syriacus]|uniref:Alpha/beta-Hydrolases superfamily protein n=1 Tax=Hibiscus syriacus TaxID=106335 RepID=A0A6A3BZM4_HIBSY|nr:hypothetical protein F3Y22_tig00018040pilonHSYRG00013 [Hibiscus syriacus]
MTTLEKNAKEIKDCIEETYWGSNKRVLLLGHSKGGVDAAAALSMYWSDLKDKVASDILRKTTRKRQEFLKKHRLPKELPVVSFHTEAAITPAGLATLSRIAHAELPLMATLSDDQPARLPVVMPLGAAMAAIAQLLQVRYGKKSDEVVARCDAEARDPLRSGHNVWMVYSSLDDDPSEPDATQVCEALLTLLVEVGQKKRHQLSAKDE